MNYAGKFGSGTPDHFSSAGLKIDALRHQGGGDSVTIPDAHLLFSGDYSRSGADLILSDQLHRVVVPNYFHGDKRPALLSPDGAPLDPHVIEAMTGHVQYAQAASTAAAAAAKVVGHVVKMTGSASVVRNGVAITLNNGDNVLQNDVVQTGSGSSLGLVMIDGTTFNLSAGARLMLNDLTYDAASTSNSSLFTLVQGAASFVAGQVAKTGDMKVGTPVATMGIRGTAVILDISAVDGKVSISVIDQRDGQVHSVQVYNTRGILIGTVTSNGAGLTLTPIANFEVIAQDSNKTVAQVAAEFSAFQTLLQTYDAGKVLFPDLPQHTDNNTANPQTKYAALGSTPTSSIATEYHAPTGGAPGLGVGGGTVTQIDFTPPPAGTGPGASSPLQADSIPLRVVVQSAQLPFVVNPSTVPQISADPGHHFGPVMSASGDVIYDPDGVIYFYDRETNTTIRVTPADDGFSYSGQTISSDGRYLVYQGTNGTDTFVYIYGTDPSDAAHYHQQLQLVAGGAPAISGDGSTILVEHGGSSIGIYTLQGELQGTITAAAAGATGTVWKPAISADGHVMAFWTSDGATAGGAGHLFTYDVTTGTITEIASTATDAGTSAASFSADGRYVVYQSDAPGGHSEIYLYDLGTGAVIFHTANAAGASYNPVISPDGHYIVFASDAHLVPGDTNAFADIYTVDVTDPNHPVYKLISVRPDGTPGDADSNLGAAISAGGKFVVFGTKASNFSNDPDGGDGDIFISDPSSGRNAIIYETASSPSILHAEGVIGLTGDRSGTVSIGVSDNSGRFTAGFDSHGDIVWHFNAARSDFDSLAYGQDASQQFFITLSAGGNTTTIPVNVTVHNGVQPAVTVVDAAPGAAPITLAQGTEDTSYTITAATLLAGAGDIDTPLSLLSITDVSIKSGDGSLHNNENGTWTYIPAPDFHGAVVFDYTVSDGNRTASSTASLVIAIVNDAATITGQRTGSVVEDSSTTTGGFLTVHDVDGGQAKFQTVSAGTLKGAYGNFTFDANTGAWNYTLVHSRADSLAAGQVEHDTLTVTSLDGTASRVICVTVTGSNEAPEITGNGEVAYTPGGPPVIVASEVFAGDADSENYDGGSFTATVTDGGGEGDTLSIVNDNKFISVIAIASGHVVMFDSDGDGDPSNAIAIGDLASNYDHVNRVTVDLNDKATDAAVEALAQAIGFENRKSSTTSGTRTVTFRLDDGDDSDYFETTVNVTAPNNPPVVDLNGEGTGVDAELSVGPGGTFNQIFANAAILDDGNIFSSMIVAWTGTFSAVSLGWSGTSLNAQFVDNGAGVSILVTGLGSASDYLAVLNAVTVRSWSIADAAFKVIVSDGTYSSGMATVNVTFEPQADWNEWEGAAQDNWNEGFNWSLGHVPDALEHVYIRAATDSEVDLVLGEGNSAVAGLQIRTGTSLNIFGDDDFTNFIVTGELVNYGGTIELDDAHFKLVNPSSGASFNSGSLIAGDNSTLELHGTIENRDGSIEASGASSHVVLDGATISGGSLDASGGVIEIVGEARSVFDGSNLGETPNVVSVTGNVLVAEGSTLELRGTILNSGNAEIYQAIRIGDADATENAMLAISGNVRLIGGGNFELASEQHSIVSSVESATATLTNVNNSIRGAGHLGNGKLTIVNEAAGTIWADLPGQTLWINTGSGTFTNHGLILASGGGIDIAGGIFNAPDGTLSAADGLLAIHGAVTAGGGAYSNASIVAGTLQLDGLSQLNVTFSGAEIGTLRLGTHAQLAGSVYGLSAGDAINLSGAGNVSFESTASGLVVSYDADHDEDLETLAISAAAESDFAVHSDGHGGVVLVYHEAPNAAPTITGDMSVVAVTGGGEVALTVADLNATDTDTTDLIFTVDHLNHGRLTFGAGRLQLDEGDTFTLADVQAGRVYYQSVGTYVGQDHITLSLSDNTYGVPTATAILGATIVDAQFTVLTAGGYDFNQDNPVAAIGSSAMLPGHSATTFTLVNVAANREFVFTGTGFGYDGLFPTSGTITSIRESTLDTHAPLVSFDLHADAGDWIAAAQAASNGDQSLIEALTSQWTFNFIGSTGADGFAAADVDDIFTGRAGNDTLEGESGYDRADYGGNAGPIGVFLAPGFIFESDSGSMDTLRSIEMVTGSNYADLFDATGFGTLSGGNVSDNVDRLFNEFEGRGGNDDIVGNGQTRVSYEHATAGVTVTFTPNSWTNTISGASGVQTGNTSVGNDHFSGVNQVRGSAFNDILTGSNNPFGSSESFEGLGGADVINGGGGGDRAVYAREQAGLVFNMAAGTVLLASDNSNTGDTLRSIEAIWGTNFGDTYDATNFSPQSVNAGSIQVSASNSVLTNVNEFEGGGGDDTVIGNGGTSVAFRHASAGVVVTLGTDGSGTADGDTSVGHDTFTGNAAGGVTRVHGSEFNDIISGNSANNILEGDSGNDVLDGQGGDNVLRGGTGADNFVYEGAGNDRISDFSRVDGDRIDLRAFSSIHSVNDLNVSTATVNGDPNSTVITFGATTLSLEGYDSVAQPLLASDFIFSGQVAITVQTHDGYDFSTMIDDLAVSSYLTPGNDSNHIIAVNAARGVTFELIGSGFAVDPEAPHAVTAGTITAIRILNTISPLQANQGHVLVNSDGWSISAADLFDDIGLYNSQEPGAHDFGVAGLNGIFNAATYNIVGGAFFSGSHRGNDVFFGGDHADIFNGMQYVVSNWFIDPGLDTVDYSHATSGVSVNLLTGATSGTAAAGDILLSIENLRGTDFNDTLTGDGNRNGLEGGLGDDTLDGGGDYNLASYRHAAPGADNIGVTVNLGIVGPQNTVQAGIDTLVNFHFLEGSAGNDTLTGNSGNNLILGGAGADALHGGDGVDTADYELAPTGVTVSLANPGLNTGEAAGDSYVSIENLTGSQFSDVLIGDAGNNTFWGLGGNDTFVFNASTGSGRDTIDDFSPGQDHIQLDYLAFTPGNTSSFNAWFASHATQQSNGVLIDLNVDGQHPNQDTILISWLPANRSLSMNDFILHPNGGGSN